MALGPFRVPLPQYHPIDIFGLSHALAAPDIARAQLAENAADQIQQLPANLMNTINQINQSKLAESNLKIAQQEALPIEKFSPGLHSALKSKGLDLEGVPVGTYKALAPFIAPLLKPNKNKTSYRDINGQTMKISTNESGDITDMQPIGPSSTASNKIQEAQADFSKADSLLSEINDLSGKLIKAKTYPETIEQAARIKLDSLTKKDPNAVAFENALNAFSSLLTRAAGEKGVLTNQDVARIIQALPTKWDTVDSAAAKSDTLRSVYESAKKGAISAYSTPVNKIISQTQNQNKNQGQPNRPQQNYQPSGDDLNTLLQQAPSDLANKAKAALGRGISRQNVFDALKQDMRKK